MQIRTDLAIETREMKGTGKIEGVIEEHEEKSGMHITKIKITNKKGEEALSKPIGTYITIELPPLTDYAENERMVTVAEELKTLLPESGLVLVAGLGNYKITPDALGPKTASLTFATRHIQGEIARSTGLENLRPVAVLAPGVLGQTGVETSEILKSLCASLKPDAVIIIDAMASRHASRIGTSVQICDSGISPGAGVGNARPSLSRETLGVPVIAMGVPTVVDATTLVSDLIGNEDNARVKGSAEPNGTPMIVTPREIDLLIERAAKLLSLSINTALHPDFTPEDFSLLVG